MGAEVGLCRPGSSAGAGVFTLPQSSPLKGGPLYFPKVALFCLGPRSLGRHLARCKGYYLQMGVWGCFQGGSYLRSISRGLSQQWHLLRRDSLVRCRLGACQICAPVLSLPYQSERESKESSTSVCSETGDGKGKAEKQKRSTVLTLSLPLAWGEALNHSGLVDGVITLSVSHRCSHED